MAAEEKKIYVYENWSSEIPRELGILYAGNVCGTEIFSFEYNEEYLKNPASCSIGPELELFQGRQFGSKRKCVERIELQCPQE